MNSRDIFVKPGTPYKTRLEKFKYFILSGWKEKTRERFIAPVKNHRHYLLIRNYILSLFAWGFICSYIFWSFQKGFHVGTPIKQGFGLAVTLALAEYYFKWYWHNKPKQIRVKNP